MKVLTELALRTELKGKALKKYVVDKNTIITPSARQFLKEKNIEIVTDGVNTEAREREEIKVTEMKETAHLYICETTGGFFNEKPEYMTHLYGNRLVYKDHPRIEFRGKLDSLQSKLLELQVVVARYKVDGLIKDLEELLTYIRKILRAEVLEESFATDMLMGLREEDIRAQSHNPMNYFKIQHILPSYQMGEVVIGLNSLRTKVRETEIAGIKAFREGGNIERQDIIKALNRMSSAVYVLMLRCHSGFYKG
ncbi:cobalamin adenosyltransferase [Alkaliphilus serpentinus]|uniref:Cobalamin adenosyltransferase n=1 Tax=Alkaliphilus serpentinus TaxID=1482731 RepID=A0A833HLC0_9FIRM|nr:cobalamin adenosyltransferase [Alkaliphilus serpentinus]KAB3525605.1 cobalamin adenosyltransferase [Alkaliphilus serpentinus]